MARGDITWDPDSNYYRIDSGRGLVRLDSDKGRFEARISGQEGFAAEPPAAPAAPVVGPGGFGGEFPPFPWFEFPEFEFPEEPPEMARLRQMQLADFEEARAQKERIRQAVRAKTGKEPEDLQADQIVRLLQAQEGKLPIPEVTQQGLDQRERQLKEQLTRGGWKPGDTPYDQSMSEWVKGRTAVEDSIRRGEISGQSALIQAGVVGPIRPGDPQLAFGASAGFESARKERLAAEGDAFRHRMGLFDLLTRTNLERQGQQDYLNRLGEIQKRSSQYALLGTFAGALPYRDIYRGLADWWKQPTGATTFAGSTGGYTAGGTVGAPVGAGAGYPVEPSLGYPVEGVPYDSYFYVP